MTTKKTARTTKKGKTVPKAVKKQIKTKSQTKKKVTPKKATSKKIAAKPKKPLQKKPTAKQKRTSHTAAKPKRAVKPAGSLKKNVNTKLSPRDRKISNIKQILVSRREALLDEAMAALNELPEQTVFPDLGDQASAEIDRNFMLRLRGRERKLLKKIEEALDRIDRGVFGICEKCGEDINIKRLEARPVTTMCIDCKTLQEEEEKFMEK